MSTDMLCAASMSLYTVDYSRGNAYYRLTNGLHVNFLTNPRSVNCVTELSPRPSISSPDFPTK